jgi:hypothetical protein
MNGKLMLSLPFIAFETRGRNNVYPEFRIKSKKMGMSGRMHRRCLEANGC